jgi:hypothetical protein
VWVNGLGRSISGLVLVVFLRLVGLVGRVDAVLLGGRVVGKSDLGIASDDDGLHRYMHTAE